MQAGDAVGSHGGSSSGGAAAGPAGGRRRGGGAGRAAARRLHRLHRRGRQSWWHLAILTSSSSSQPAIVPPALPALTYPCLPSHFPPQVNDTLNACPLSSTSCISTLSDDEEHFEAPWSFDGDRSAAAAAAAEQPHWAGLTISPFPGALAALRHSTTPPPPPPLSLHRTPPACREAAIEQLVAVACGGAYEGGLIDSFGGIRQTDAAAYIAKGVLAVATGAWRQGVCVCTSAGWAPA